MSPTPNEESRVLGPFWKGRGCRRARTTTPLLGSFQVWEAQTEDVSTYLSRSWEEQRSMLCWLQQRVLYGHRARAAGEMSSQRISSHDPTRGSVLAQLHFLVSTRDSPPCLHPFSSALWRNPRSLTLGTLPY